MGARGCMGGFSGQGSVFSGQCEAASGLLIHHSSFITHHSHLSSHFHLFSSFVTVNHSIDPSGKIKEVQSWICNNWCANSKSKTSRKSSCLWPMGWADCRSNLAD